MRTCVTGANGFVGSKLCEALADRGDATTGVVRTTSDLQFLTPIRRVTVRHGDLTDRDSLLGAFRDVEVVFHVAALASDWGDWDVFRRVNVDGVRNVMECALASGVRRVVHVSSVSVYGFPGRTNVPEDAGFISRPEDPYITT
jgi:dihydroflavonol-4-reductase